MSRKRSSRKTQKETNKENVPPPEEKKSQDETAPPTESDLEDFPEEKYMTENFELVEDGKSPETVNRSPPSHHPFTPGQAMPPTKPPPPPFPFLSSAFTPPHHKPMYSDTLTPFQKYKENTATPAVNYHPRFVSKVICTCVQHPYDFNCLPI